MTDPDSESFQAELVMLSRAREGLSPTRADRDRVRQSIAAALVFPAAAPGRPRLGGRTGSTDFASHASLWVPRLLVASAIAVSAGSLGYWAGHHAGLRESRWASPASPPSLALLPPPSAQRFVASPAPEEPAAPSPAIGREARLAPGPVRTARPDPRRPAAAEAGARLSAAASLEQEVSALRSVERALRDRQYGLALALLQALDRAVPRGQLGEEREATSAIARCALGAAPLGVDLAEDFGDRYPDSVYLRRVEQSCAAAAESKAASRRTPTD